VGKVTGGVSISSATGGAGAGKSNPWTLIEYPSLAGLSHLKGAELCEEADQECIVPAGALEFAFHRPLGAFKRGKGQREAPEKGDILRSVILSISRLVFVHGHVENPVQSILDPPMRPRHLAKAFGRERGAE